MLERHRGTRSALAGPEREREDESDRERARQVPPTRGSTQTEWARMRAREEDKQRARASMRACERKADRCMAARDSEAKTRRQSEQGPNKGRDKEKIRGKERHKEREGVHKE